MEFRQFLRDHNFEALYCDEYPCNEFAKNHIYFLNEFTMNFNRLDTIFIKETDKKTYEVAIHVINGEGDNHKLNTHSFFGETLLDALKQARNFLNESKISDLILADVEDLIG